ncbi:MAG TPA: hypothetical protein VNZ52_03800 [Candidatus Thermoplasmatota archaeon]|nr:hypothetical protein [Candidatus Thermoplasmatota archaeon]
MTARVQDEAEGPYPRRHDPESDRLELRVYQALTVAGGLFPLFGGVYGLMTFTEASAGEPLAAVAIGWFTLCLGIFGSLLTLYSGLRLPHDVEVSRHMMLAGAFLAPAAPAVGFVATAFVVAFHSWFGLVFLPAAGGGVLGALPVLLAFVGSRHLTPRKTGLA